MTVCPWCFSPLLPDQVAFVCTGSCQPQPDPQKSLWAGKRGQTTSPITLVERSAEDKRWVAPTVQPCRVCDGPTKECCLTCHFALPRGWRQGHAVTVAFAGARSTGKTVYIGVLVHFLALAMEARHRAFGYANEASRREFDYYEKQLFETQGLPAATGAAATQPNFMPMIISLGEHQGIPRYLVLRDVAGEELEDAAPKDHLGFFCRADLVVFLFDPLRVPEIYAQVHERIASHRQILGGEPTAVLARVLELMQGRGRLAVCMSKFDIMHQLGSVQGSAYQAIMSNLGSSLLHDVGPLRTPSLADQELLDAEVRSLLALAHAQNLVNTVTAAQQKGIECRYFAVSALGNAPDADGVHPHGIAPFRVLDPILWVLARMGAV